MLISVLAANSSSIKAHFDDKSVSIKLNVTLIYPCEPSQRGKDPLNINDEKEKHIQYVEDDLNNWRRQALTNYLKEEGGKGVLTTQYEEWSKMKGGTFTCWVRKHLGHSKAHIFLGILLRFPSAPWSWNDERLQSGLALAPFPLVRGALMKNLLLINEDLCVR